MGEMSERFDRSVPGPVVSRNRLLTSVRLGIVTRSQRHSQSGTQTRPLGCMPKRNGRRSSLGAPGWRRSSSRAWVPVQTAMSDPATMRDPRVVFSEPLRCQLGFEKHPDPD
jgi:hypothetical protein